MSQPERKPGHSVVEIMITVIGIIVLIGLAVPAHRGLGVRASVAECVAAANEAGPTGQSLRERLGAVPQCVDVREAGDDAFVVTVHDSRAEVDPVLKVVRATDARPGMHWRCSQLRGDPRHMPAECRTAAGPVPSAGLTRNAAVHLQQAGR